MKFQPRLTRRGLSAHARVVGTIAQQCLSLHWLLSNVIFYFLMWMDHKIPKHLAIMKTC